MLLIDMVKLDITFRNGDSVTILLRIEMNSAPPDSLPNVHLYQSKTTSEMMTDSILNNHNRSPIPQKLDGAILSFGCG